VIGKTRETDIFPQCRKRRNAIMNENQSSEARNDLRFTRIERKADRQAPDALNTGSQKAMRLFGV
jgi:hypothetical protein